MVWKDNALWKFLLSAFLTNWFSLTRVYDCKILYLIMLRAFTMIPNKERLTLCLISITISCLRSCWELLQWFQIKRTGILFDVNLSSWSSGFFFFFLLFSAIDPCSSLPRLFPIIVYSLCRLLRWSKRRGWSFHSTQDLSLNSPFCLPYLSLSHALRIWF